MKVSHILLITFIVLINFSCRSSKELIYFKDADDNEKITGLPKEYTLKPGDILYVSIKSISPEVNALFNPESGMEAGARMSSGYEYSKFASPSSAYLYGFEVYTDGNIKLPMLGKINVLERTLSEAEKIVQKKADEFLNDAVVKVKLLNFKVTVTGEVRNPGAYYNYNNSISVLEAVAMAGGHTDFASINNIKVIRRYPDENKSFLINLTEKDIYQSEAFFLQPNDYVIVQPDKYKNFQLNSQAYSLFFSSISLLLAVLGFAIK